MSLKPLSDLVDEWYTPGSPARRQFDYFSRRQRRIMKVTGFVYRALHRIPPRWITLRDDQYGMHNYAGLGPVVAQFWHDILDGLLQRFEGRRGDDKSSLGDIFYNALDGLAWRFFNDEYVPTWSDVKEGRSGNRRLTWRLRRRHITEHAEALADDYFNEKADRGVAS